MFLALTKKSAMHFCSFCTAQHLCWFWMFEGLLVRALFILKHLVTFLFLFCVWVVRLKAALWLYTVQLEKLPTRLPPFTMLGTFIAGSLGHARFYAKRSGTLKVLTTQKYECNFKILVFAMQYFVVVCCVEKEYEVLLQWCVLCLRLGELIFSLRSVTNVTIRCQQWAPSSVTSLPQSLCTVMLLKPE